MSVVVVDLADQIPEFKSEGEEARWWDEHPDFLAGLFSEAKTKGALRRLSQTNVLARVEQSRNVTIKLPASDLERARVLAGQERRTVPDLHWHARPRGVEAGRPAETEITASRGAGAVTPQALH